MTDEVQIPSNTNNNGNNIDNIEKENNNKIIEQIINLKLKSFFNFLKSILKKRDNFFKVQFFTYLKYNKSNYNYNK